MSLTDTRTLVGRRYSRDTYEIKVYDYSNPDHVAYRQVDTNLGEMIAHTPTLVIEIPGPLWRSDSIRAQLIEALSVPAGTDLDSVRIGAPAPAPRRWWHRWSR